MRIATIILVMASLTAPAWAQRVDIQGGNIHIEAPNVPGVPGGNVVIDNGSVNVGGSNIVSQSIGSNTVTQSVGVGSNVVNQSIGGAGGNIVSQTIGGNTVTQSIAGGSSSSVVMNGSSQGITVINGEVWVDGEKVPPDATRFTGRSGKTYVIDRHGGSVSVRQQ